MGGWSELTCHNACCSYWELFFLIKFFLTRASLCFIFRVLEKVDSDDLRCMLYSEEEIVRGP